MFSLQVEGHKIPGRDTEEIMEDEMSGEEADEEEEQSLEEVPDLMQDSYSVTELVLKSVEGKPSDIVITNISELQKQLAVFPVSRIL